MSDYTQTYDFSAKDALSSGDPSKKILGAEVDTELAAIAAAIATKYDSADIATQGTAEAGADNTVLMTPLRSEQHLAVWAAENAGAVGDIQALADPNADRILFWDDSAGAMAFLTPGSGLAISGADLTLDIAGLSSDTPDPAADYLVMYDSSAGGLKKILIQDMADAVQGTMTCVFKTADESVTSSTTLQDDDELSITLASGYYAVEMLLVYEGDTAADIKVNPAVSGGVWHHPPATGTNVQYLSDNGSSYALPALGAAVDCYAVLIGYISTAGATYTLQWAQNASSATPTKVLAGSYIRAIKLA